MKRFDTTKHPCTDQSQGTKTNARSDPLYPDRLRTTKALNKINLSIPILVFDGLFGFAILINFPDIKHPITVKIGNGGGTGLK